MINNFKKNDNKSSIDNILQNKDDYNYYLKLLIRNINILLKMLVNI
jgi:hypothetical protein